MRLCLSWPAVNFRVALPPIVVGRSGWRVPAGCGIRRTSQIRLQLRSAAAVRPAARLSPSEGLFQAALGLPHFLHPYKPQELAQPNLATRRASIP